MSGLYESLFAFLQMSLTYLVCAVVWFTLMAGLYQLVRDKLRRTRLVQRRSRRLVQTRQIS